MADIFVVRERDGERRVAATPETVARYRKAGHAVTVAKGAGEGSRIPDEAFAEAGATLAAPAAVSKADIVLAVRRPAPFKAKPGAALVCILDPFGHEGEVAALRDTGASLFALDLAPRTTRAQALDVLSSQANLAGYRAVIDAAAAFDRALPLMMTAAGTVPAAKVFVMGAGVAGLQAIATARRLGAVVSATDVRAAAAEQVASLGAKFVMTDALKDASGTGGYARELTAEETDAQNELVAAHIAKQDIVVTTALIPGRPAPRLVTRAMLRSMRPGSVVVDLARERGGNVEGVEGVEGAGADGEAVIEGVTVIGHANVPARIAASASALYARNAAAFLDLLVKDGEVAIDMEDDILAATLVARDGTIVHERLKDAVPDAPAKPKNATKAAKPKTAAKPKAANAKAANAKAAARPGAAAKTKAPARKTAAAKTAAKAPARKTATAKTAASKAPARKARPKADAAETSE